MSANSFAPIRPIMPTRTGESCRNVGANHVGEFIRPDSPNHADAYGRIMSQCRGESCRRIHSPRFAQSCRRVRANHADAYGRIMPTRTGESCRRIHSPLFAQSCRRIHSPRFAPIRPMHVVAPTSPAPLAQAHHFATLMSHCGLRQSHGQWSIQPRHHPLPVYVKDRRGKSVRTNGVNAWHRCQSHHHSPHNRPFVADAWSSPEYCRAC